MIDELLQKKLLRQMRLLNIWMSFFGTLIIVAVVAGGIVLYQIWSFTQMAAQKIDGVTNAVKSVDVKDSVCTGDNALSKYLQQKTEACN